MHRPFQPFDRTAGCPTSRISRLAGDVSSSYLESRILSALPSAHFFRLPQVLALPASPMGESSGIPDFCTFQLRQRLNLQVAPNLRSSGGAGSVGSPSCPGHRTFRLFRRSIFRVAPASRSQRHLPIEAPGCPVPSPFLQRQGCLFGYPRVQHPPVPPQMRPRASPNPALTAGPMMTLWLGSNFASSTQARVADESSCPIRSCTFLPNSGCNPNLPSAFRR
jgi:hypothetical protein